MGLVLLIGASACAGAGSDAAAPRGPTARYCAVQAEFAELDLLYDNDPVEVRKDLRALLALTRKAARTAPPAVRDDARAAVEIQQRFNALYATHGWDPDATNRDEEFIAFANSAEVGALYLRLEAFQSERCGADPRSDAPDLA